MFPWLSAVARSYETYKFRSLLFSFNTATATTASGRIVMSFDPNVTDPRPTDQVSALSAKNSIGGVVWSPLDLRINLADCDRYPVHYIRPGNPVRANAVETIDPKMYDLGNLHVVLDGVAAGTVGILQVHYEVDLFTPQLPDGIGGDLTNTDDLDATHLFGTVTALTDVDGIFPGEFSGGTTFTFDQAFSGLIMVKVIGTTIAADMNLHGSGPGYTQVTAFGSMANADSTASMSGFWVKCGSGCTLVPTNTAAAISTVHWTITPAPDVLNQ